MEETINRPRGLGKKLYTKTGWGRKPMGRGVGLTGQEKTVTLVTETDGRKDV